MPPSVFISKLMEGMKDGTDPRVLTVGSITGLDNSVDADGVYPIADLMDLEGFEAGFKAPVCMADGYGFSAAKAIMLLKEERNAIKAAAEKAAALSEQRKKRHGGGRSGRGEI